jgi:hypothetical protein
MFWFAPFLLPAMTRPEMVMATMAAAMAMVVIPFRRPMKSAPDRRRREDRKVA